MEQRIDMLNSQATVKTLEGLTVKVGSSIEVYAAICNAKWARVAIRKAGRPGMPLWRGSLVKATANIAASFTRIWI